MEEWKRLRVKEYAQLNKMAKKGGILFVGSSLCQLFPVNELAQSFGMDKIIYNRGVSGFVTEELLESMEECVFQLSPSKIFINIGTNDLSRSDNISDLLYNYERIIFRIKERLPRCRILMMAYYPINRTHDFGLSQEERDAMFGYRTNDLIRKANLLLKDCSEKWGCGFIDVNHVLIDEEGQLKAEFSTEGMHLMPNAYGEILKAMAEFL